MREPSEADLQRRAAGGDRLAFEVLCLRHWPDLLNFVHEQNRSLNEHAAEDVSSETIFRVWQDLGRLTSVESLSAYLKTIAKNIVARGYRVQRPREVDIPPHIAASGLSSHDTLERDELSRQVSQAVESLAKSRRLALECSQAGLSAKEIAGRLGSTENAARRLVQKAKKDLAHALSRCGDSCAFDRDRSDECLAEKENVHCLKAIYIRKLRS